MREVAGMRAGGLMGEMGIKYVMSTHTSTHLNANRKTHKHRHMQVHALSFLLKM